MYRTPNEHYKERFGCKVYKLSIDAGFTCPNRDGTLGTGDGAKRNLVAPVWTGDKKRALNELRRILSEDGNSFQQIQENP